MNRVAGLVFLSMVLSGCSGSGEVPTPVESAATTNDCPARVDCHPEWRSCHCTLTARGDLATTEADIDGDGRPNFRMTYFYDDQARLLRWENDQGADGTIEQPCTFDPPCPPPHPNDTCSCFTPPREVSREYVEERLGEAAGQ